MKNLSEIETGSSVTISTIKEGPLYLKLMEMGFLPGEEVFVERKAPFGDPIAVKVSGYHISLRKDEAVDIIVED